MATKKKLKATEEKSLASFTRMDHAGNCRLFIGLKEEALSGTEVILPTDGFNGDKFYCIDSGETYMLYKNTWYKLK